jgi:glucose-1-phosphate cytidylyltransferase
MQPGDELVIQPFRRLIQERQLAAFEYDGFFAAMDTFKDKQHLDTLYEGGQPPWEVWKDTNGGSEKGMLHSHQQTSVTSARHSTYSASTLREAKTLDGIGQFGKPQ